jgi:hypothetical protein
MEEDVLADLTKVLLARTQGPVGDGPDVELRRTSRSARSLRAIIARHHFADPFSDAAPDEQSPLALPIFAKKKPIGAECCALRSHSLDVKKRNDCESNSAESHILGGNSCDHLEITEPKN